MPEDSGLFLKRRVYGLNWHQLRMNWNFNRWFLFLGFALFRRSQSLTEKLIIGRDKLDSGLSSSVYRRFGAKSTARKASQSLDVLVVAEHGRFGNSIRQFANALATAEILGIREVVAKSLPMIPRSSWELRNGIRLTHDPLLKPRVVTRPVTALGGDFFVFSRLPKSVEAFDYSQIATDLGSLLAIRIDKPLPARTLVIHIRSGDAFSVGPHRSLGQPPLAFYTAVIERLKPTNVVLVFEDDKNPVVGALLRWLGEVKIEFDIQSANFAADLAVLLSARTLITARGTLGDAVELVSPNLQRIATFGKKSQSRFPQSKSVKRLKVWDPAGTYSSANLMSNWRNTPQQRSLLLDFQPDQLTSRWDVTGG